MARFHLKFLLHLLPVTQATRSCFDFSPHDSSGMVFLYTFHKQLAPNVVLSACSVYTTVSVIATLILHLYLTVLRCHTSTNIPHYP